MPLYYYPIGPHIFYGECGTRAAIFVELAVSAYTVAELMVGVRNYDIPTYCLKGNCSSAELHTHVVGLMGHDPTASDLRDQYSAN